MNAKAMRNLPEVVDAMLAEIPDSEGERELRQRLCDLKTSALFSSPEATSHHWQRGQNILMDLLPMSDEALNEWQRRIIDLWMDRRGND